MFGRRKRLHDRRSAMIFERHGIIVVEGGAYWEGASAATEYFVVIEAGTPDEVLGNQLLQTFDVFDGWPVLKGDNRRMFDALAVTSQTQLVKECSAVAATQDGTRVELQPFRPHPPGVWFSEVGDDLIVREAPPAAELGAAVREALDAAFRLR